MNILITGATGFIGSHLSNAAIEAGHNVFALRYNETQAPISMDDRIVWFDGDIMSDSFSIPQDIRVIVHAAAIGVSPQKTSWIKGIQVNTVGTLNILEASIRRDVKNVLIIGSVMETGESKDQNSDQLNPVGVYAITKAVASVIAIGFARTHNMNLISTRLTNVYGEGQYDQNLFPSLKNAALKGSNFKIKNGSTLKNFISIEHVCRELLVEIDSFSNMNNEVKNKVICNETDQTVFDFATFWWNHWGAKGQLEQD